MAKKMVKSRASVKHKAKTKTKPKTKPKVKKSLLLAVSKETSDLKSDEPTVREGSYTPGLENEDDVEEQEDGEEKTFYGRREEGI